MWLIITIQSIAITYLLHREMKRKGYIAIIESRGIGLVAQLKDLFEETTHAFILLEDAYKSLHEISKDPDEKAMVNDNLRIVRSSMNYTYLASEDLKQTLKEYGYEEGCSED